MAKVKGKRVTDWSLPTNQNWLRAEILAYTDIKGGIILDNLLDKLEQDCVIDKKYGLAPWLVTSKLDHMSREGSICHKKGAWVKAELQFCKTAEELNTYKCDSNNPIRCDYAQTGPIIPLCWVPLP